MGKEVLDLTEAWHEIIFIMSRLDKGFSGSYFALQGVYMMSTYILFRRKSPAVHPHWVETIEGLENAKRRLNHYRTKSNEDYYLFDVSAGRELSVLVKARSASVSS